MVLQFVFYIHIHSVLYTCVEMHVGECCSAACVCRECVSVEGVCGGGGVLC